MLWGFLPSLSEFLTGFDRHIALSFVGEYEIFICAYVNTEFKYFIVFRNVPYVVDPGKTSLKEIKIEVNLHDILVHTEYWLSM